MGLAEFRGKIYGAQSLRGKILRLNDLQPHSQRRIYRVGLDHDELIWIPRQGQMSHVVPVENFGLDYSAPVGGLPFTPDGGMSLR
jgi:hypothetical protein